MTVRFDGDVNAVREWLRLHRHAGVDCPACDQFVKLYPRAITATMARGLIAVYRYQVATGEPWVCLLRVLTDIRMNTQFCLLRNWGLIEPKPGQRDDGSRRTGWWNVTSKGQGFVLDRLKLPKYAMVYNGNTEYYDGPLLGITEALGKRFNYRELMR